jgi:hypothetical protein
VTQIGGSRGAQGRRRSTSVRALVAGLLGLLGFLGLLGGCVVLEVPIGQDGGGPAVPDGPAQPGDPGDGPDRADPAEPVEPTEGAATAEQLVLELANQARADHGLDPLEPHEDLAGVARAWSAQLAGEGADLAHNPEVADQVPPGWSGVGENVGWVDEGGRWSPERVAEHTHEGWMGSEGHRENVLRDGWTHLGVGVAHHEDHGWYLTQVFATY